MKSEQEFMELYDEYEMYIDATAKKRFYNTSLQMAHGITRDDILQHGRLGLYKAYKEYDKSKGTSFKTFALSNIFWSMSVESKKESLSKDATCSFKTIDRVSLDHTIPGDEDEVSTMHDTVSDPLASEQFDNIEIQESIERIKQAITPQVHRIVELRLKGYTVKEIAEMLGVTHQRVSYLLRFHKDRIKKILVG